MKAHKLHDHRSHPAFEGRVNNAVKRLGVFDDPDAIRAEHGLIVLREAMARHRERRQAFIEHLARVNAAKDKRQND